MQTQNTSPVICACGCGQEVRRVKYPNCQNQPRFINTHQHKGSNNGNFRGGKLQKPCAICNAPFDIWPSASAARVTCGDDECAKTWQRLSNGARGQNKITVNCHFCGKELRKFPSQVVDRNHCNRFCLAAANPKTGPSNGNWKNGKDKYWMEQSRIRDGHKCAICSFDIVIETHHITPRSKQGARTPDNLITLCPNHHRMADLGIINVEHLRCEWTPLDTENTDWASAPNRTPHANR